MASSSHITPQLYPDVEKMLKNKAVCQEYKTGIDRYMAKNSDKYFIVGPGDRPVFGTDDIDSYIKLIGLTKERINQVLKDSKHIGSNWHIINNPFNIANVLATRYFLLSKNDEYIKYSQWYLLVSLYPSLHWKYFKHGTNEACMAYTVNNLSEKFYLKQAGSLWNAMLNMMVSVFNLHSDGIRRGDDMDYVKYVQDVHTRINSLLKNVSNEYYKNYKDQRFLTTEHESFEEDNYYEADSNSYVIERISNKVVTHLVVNGPDMRLVEIAAKTNSISVNELRNYVSTMITEKQREDIQSIVESILFLYLFNEDGEHHSATDIGTNNFMIYCLQIYKRSNTTDKNVIRIKAILDRWLDELGLMKKTDRSATIIAFRKAFFSFFVMTIQKLA